MRLSTSGSFARACVRATERAWVQLDELFIVTQPGHLQKLHSEKLSTEERDFLRADMLREHLIKVARPVMKD